MRETHVFSQHKQLTQFKRYSHHSIGNVMPQVWSKRFTPSPLLNSSTSCTIVEQTGPQISIGINLLFSSLLFPFALLCSFLHMYMCLALLCSCLALLCLACLAIFCTSQVSLSQKYREQNSATDCRAYWARKNRWTHKTKVHGSPPWPGLAFFWWFGVRTLLLHWEISKVRYQHPFFPRKT